jgi:hypothetical protein
MQLKTHQHLLCLETIHVSKCLYMQMMHCATNPSQIFAFIVIYKEVSD